MSNKSQVKIVNEYIQIINKYLSKKMSVSRQQEVLVVLPEGSLPAKQVVLIDAACDGSSLSNTRTVTYKIGCSVSIREERLVLLCRC